MGFIYKITNVINGKIYIGKTSKTIEDRFKNHIKQAKRGDDNSYLHSAMKKYGFENFLVEQLDVADSIEELNSKEIYWIDKLDSRNSHIGYNQAAGGDGGDIFSTLSTEQQDAKRRKHSIDSSSRMWITNGVVDKFIHIGEPIPENFYPGRHPLSDEHKRKISESERGRVVSESTIQKRREKRIGHVVSEETREKLRVANLGKRYLEETNKKKGRTRKGSDNPAFGTHYKWLTNGTEDIRIYESNYDKLPLYYNIGYKDGRCNKFLFKGVDK